MLSIPVLLLACSEDWTCNFQMIVSLEAQGTNAYNLYAFIVYRPTLIRLLASSGSGKTTANTIDNLTF